MTQNLLTKLANEYRPVFSANQYREFIEKYDRFGFRFDTSSEASAGYWSKVPRYVVAICPICRFELVDQTDLHSLRIVGNQIEYDRHYWHGGEKEPDTCPHYMLNQVFLNLNKNRPEWDLKLHSEIPYLNPFFFSDEQPENSAVTTAFPIFALLEEEFQPVHLFFVTSYFGMDRKRFLRLLPHKQGDWPRIHYTPGEAWKYKDTGTFDWEEWVERGRLYWLDKKNGDTVLGNTPGEYPYANIEGFVDEFEIRDGQLISHGPLGYPRHFPTWSPTQKERFRLGKWWIFLQNVKFFGSIFLFLAFVSGMIFLVLRLFLGN